MGKWLIYYLITINLFSFILFGIDKYKAVHHKWRISEAHLIGTAALGGAAGALIGMLVFHHKTRKKKFYLGVPCLLFLWIIGILFFVK